MADSTAALCVTIPRARHEIHDGFLEPAYCHVYANKKAHPVIKAGTGSYPPGSLIVKAKFRDVNAPERVELYTVMRKRAVGYDLENGDWEYSVVDGRTRRVLTRGTIESCIGCHCEYKSTDYVTREYLTPGNGEP
ncbi:cytochrome P460 family protein [Candidatus Laterigemmans baculatus]|uniref:cytochrome P460 family protein n=1 Tax=Candidatus Laterigemmans baculatus TaxID=2770505 RepID=UPI0013DB8362|nr:cytochrome P460 family protein [Candidatus Laterigemmans baculatus]